MNATSLFKALVGNEIAANRAGIARRNRLGESFVRKLAFIIGLTTIYNAFIS